MRPLIAFIVNGFPEELNVHGIYSFTMCLDLNRKRSRKSHCRMWPASQDTPYIKFFDFRKTEFISIKIYLEIFITHRTARIAACICYVQSPKSASSWSCWPFHEVANVFLNSLSNSGIGQPVHGIARVCQTVHEVSSGRRPDREMARGSRPECEMTIGVRKESK